MNAEWTTMVRIRQLIDQARHRLQLIPMLFVAAAIVMSQVMLAVDRTLTDERLPQLLETTVGSGRAILSAIASGLIASITLLLSLMLVAVQLAGSQFSPRTLRDWIGDRTQQRTIGVVLGTTIFCLLILRETRTIGDGQALTPHLSVLLALAGGVLSLVAVVRSVGHLTDSLRVGSVAGSIAADTVELIEKSPQLAAVEHPAMVPAPAPGSSEVAIEPPDDAEPVPAPIAGWIQQIDEDAILAAIDEGSTVYVSTALGTFTLPNAPMVWVWPTPDQECIEAIQRAIALGDTRTMQQDIGFGILQLVDIALRALSPGVNDPNTANDLTVHLGVVMLALWERPMAPARRVEEGRTLIRYDLQHGDYLHAAFDQLRRYGSHDSEVAATIIRTLVALHTETTRRDLPGPLDPIEEIIAQTLEAVDACDLSDYDKQLVRELAPKELNRYLP